MKTPSNDMSRFQIAGKKSDLLGEAMTLWFGRNCFWVWRKHGKGRTDRVFTEMQKIDDHDFTNLMQRVYHD
jgi:hypothetical protein